MPKSELRGLPISKLKGLLWDRGVSATGCVEKEDLVDLIDRTCR
jgi:hypothetical protein